LDKNLGDGETKKIILNGLEEILGMEFIDYPKNLFNGEIDYSFMIKNNYPSQINVRIQNAFSSYNIKTPNDIAKLVYERYIKDKKLRQKEWKNEKTYNQIISNKYTIRNIGKKSAFAIIEYLKSINFDFSEEYAKEIYELNKE